MMSLLGTLLVGFIVGLIARARNPGEDSRGWIKPIVRGVAGSMLASYAGAAMGWYPAGSSAGWIASIIGAVVLLFLYNLVRGKGKS